MGLDGEIGVAVADVMICLCVSLWFSVELRELESKLKLAYLNRERAAQIAEKDAMRYETMVRAHTHSHRAPSHLAPSMGDILAHLKQADLAHSLRPTIT